MKNTLLFICSTNILVRLLTVNMKNCLTPKNPKMCDPILVTLLKMRPHYSQYKSSSENVTPSSGTSLLASHKEVPPSPPRQHAFSCTSFLGNMKRKMLVIQHQWKMVIGTDDKLTNDMRRILLFPFLIR